MPGPADRQGGEEEVEEEEEEEVELLSINNNNVGLAQLSKPEPPPLSLQPLPRSLTMKYTGISSSPYKVRHGWSKEFYFSEYRAGGQTEE